jgi:hypothetical protein
MNHQPGPETDGADSTAADGTAGSVTPAARKAEVGAEPDDADAAPAETDAAAGEPADHEVATVREPARPETGEPRVDAALTLLDRLTELPVTEHAAVFERVHAELTAVLGQLDPESAGADD